MRIGTLKESYVADAALFDSRTQHAWLAVAAVLLLLAAIGAFTYVQGTEDRYVGKCVTGEKVVSDVQSLLKETKDLNGDPDADATRDYLVRLGKAKENKLTVSIGEFCSKKVLGVCLEKKRGYCQFDSKLAQIVQQQGRNGQLHIGFGKASSPDCRGITQTELQQINFEALDFSNFFDDLQKNKKIPDNDTLTKRVREEIAAQLKNKQ